MTKMKNIDEEFKRLEANVNRIRVTRHVYGEMLDFFEGMIRFALEQKRRVKVEIPVIPADVVLTKISEGFPLINREDFPVDTNAAGKFLQHVGEIIPENNEELGETSVNLVKFLESSDPEDEFWKYLLVGDEESLKTVASKLDSPLHQIIFLGVFAIKPSVWFVRSELEKLLSPGFQWRKNYCPVCGSLPSLLLLKGKEGRKYGSCSWCDHQWLMNRIECPYCLNQLQESLGYIAIEDDEVYRVEYCDACKYYFKLIDCRPLEVEPALPLEELTTLHLDMIARNRGYKMPPALSPVVYGKDPG